MIQCQKCNVIGWEGHCAEEDLEQENMAPQVLEVESQAIEGYADCTSAVNKRQTNVIRFGADVMRVTLTNVIRPAARGRRQGIKASSVL